MNTNIDTYDFEALFNYLNHYPHQHILIEPSIIQLYHNNKNIQTTPDLLTTIHKITKELYTPTKDRQTLKINTTNYHQYERLFACRYIYPTKSTIIINYIYDTQPGPPYPNETTIDNIFRETDLFYDYK